MTSSTAEGPRAWQVILVVLAAIVPYAQTVRFDFTYDDRAHVVGNAFVRDLANASKLWPWSYLDQEIPDQARPVLVASHFADLALGGPSPAGYHAQSTMWHVFVSVLVLLFALRLGLGGRVATVAAVLFALPPVHAEAVAAISNREDLLATFFVLATLLSVRAAFASGRLVSWLGPAALYALALGSKEVAVAAPLLVVLVLVCFPAWRPAASWARRAYVAAALAALLVTAAWGSFQLRLGFPSLLQGAGGHSLELAAIPRSASGALLRIQIPVPVYGDDTPALSRRPHGEIGWSYVAPAEAFRAWQLVVPWPLRAEYDLEAFGDPWIALGAALLLVALLVAAAWAFRRRREPAFGVGWFLLATAPVLVAPTLINPVADRYQYLPAVGACIVLSWALVAWLPTTRVSRLGWALAGLLVLTFAIVGVHRVGIWHDDRTLFEETARHAPRSVRVQVNLGAARMRVGDRAGARRAFERAVALDPGHLAARYDLGVLDEGDGRPSDAVDEYIEALRRPSPLGEHALRDRALVRLARLLMRQRRRAELERIVGDELRARPSSSAARALAARLEARE